MLSFTQRLSVAKEVVLYLFAGRTSQRSGNTNWETSEPLFTGGVRVDLNECFNLETPEEQYFWYLDKGLLPTDRHRHLMAKQTGCDMQKLAATEKERADAHF
jgi:hypothetical protein